jgi:hypothetical protein
LRAAPRADPNVRVSRIRLLARVIASRSGAVCRSSSLHSFARPCVGRMGEPNSIALAPPPSLHPLRPSLQPLCSRTSTVLRSAPTPKIRASSATVTSFPTRSALDCSTGLLHGRRILALPIPAHDESVHAQVSDPAPFAQPLPERSERCCLPRALTTSAPGSCTLISGLNTGPAHSPINASRVALPPHAHDTRPGWLARPSLLGTCTPSTRPVLIGAPQRSGSTALWSAAEQRRLKPGVIRIVLLPKVGSLKGFHLAKGGEQDGILWYDRACQALINQRSQHAHLPLV